MRSLSLFSLLLWMLLVAGCSACSTQVPCSANRDCTDGQVCAAGADGSFCVAAGEEGEGEGEPAASLRLQSGTLEGDEALDVTVEWTLAFVSGCELQADGVDTGVALSGQASSAMVIEESQTLQIVCNEAESEELAFVVHDVSEIGGPVAVSAGASVTLTFTVEGVSSCTVTTDGASANLSQPVITGADGSFTDTADADKNYTLICSGAEGDIIRTFLLNVLTVELLTPPAGFVTYGDSLSVTVGVEASATCSLISASHDGSDRQVETSATTVGSGESRTLTLPSVTDEREYLVACTLDSATAETIANETEVRPRINSFDAFIPNIEELNGAAATLQLAGDVSGIDFGGWCDITAGSSPVAIVLRTATPGALLTSGATEALYRLRCVAGSGGGDPGPIPEITVRVLWRDATEADLALIASVRIAMGDIVIDNTALASVDTGILEQVGGDFIINDVSAVGGTLAIDAPNLTDVGGGLAVGLAGDALPLVTSLDFSVLRTSNSLNVSTGGLTEVALPALASVDSGFLVYECPNLQVVDLPALETTRYLYAEESAALHTVSAPVLGTTTGDSAGVYLRNLPALTTLELDSLATINGDLLVEGVGLSTLVLDGVTEIRGSTTLLGNPVLSSVNVWRVTRLGSEAGNNSLTIQNNPLLAGISRLSLIAVDSAGGFLVVGNGALTCPIIESLYCPFTTRTDIPNVSNNATVLCGGVNQYC